MDNPQHFIAGCGAGMIGTVVGHPMDTIKTHQQMSNRRLTTTEVIKRIIKKDGILGMYKGMLFPLLSSGSLNSLFFGIHHVVLKILQSKNDKILPTNADWLQDLFIAGCIGGVAQTFVTCPSELIKIKIQLGKGIYKNYKYKKYLKKKLSTYLTTRDIYRRFGTRGFFVGFIPTMYRDALSGGIYISSYQYIRHYMYGELNLDPGLLETLVAGGVAGIASWIPVIPFDTIKSRIQADDFQNPLYKGMIDCSANIFKYSSFRGFFKGFFMITVRSIPVNVAVIYGYELTLWLFKSLDKKHSKKSK